MAAPQDLNDTKSAPHVLTVALEDYYHVKAFNRLIHSGRWYRFENRLEQNTDRALQLLDDCGTKATFFAFGHVAESMPGLVRRIADQGHEIGSRGMYPRDVAQLTPEELRHDLARSKAVVEQAAGRKVVGFRAGEVWNDPNSLWILDLVAEAGYLYDSSFCPWLLQASGRPDLLFTHKRQLEHGDLWVLPLSTFSTLGWRLPMGGNFFRQFPRWKVRREYRNWTTRYASPLVTYFNVWEVDPDQPRIEAAPLLQRVRQYRHLDRMDSLLRETFRTYRFTSASHYLDLAEHHALPVPRLAAARIATPTPLRALEPTAVRLPVTLVVPCFNEAGGLAYLRNTLQSVQKKLSGRLDLRVILVDDASTDATLGELRSTFGDLPNFRILAREWNGGVAAAIMSGIEAAETEVVASIDADCSYDPHELGAMVELLAPDVDLVTASPYHPDGGVLNVPGWRLSLSRTLSWMYQRILTNQLHTYTSCFRVYRRSSALRVQVDERGFLGVAEFIAKLDLMGARIVEFPTTLEVRILGRSKMRTLRTIMGQLRLLLRVTSLRRSRSAGTALPARPVPAVTRAQP